MMKAEVLLFFEFGKPLNKNEFKKNWKELKDFFFDVWFIKILATNVDQLIWSSGWNYMTHSAIQNFSQ